MGRDDKSGAEEVDEDDGGESHAADEPTAVWDENALRAAGLGDLWRKREAEPGAPATVPAATPAKGAADASIVIEENLGAQTQTPVPAPMVAKASPLGKSSGLGWGATLGIALALGAVVYALIRYLKG